MLGDGLFAEHKSRKGGKKGWERVTRRKGTSGSEFNKKLEGKRGRAGREVLVDMNF